ncbi:hypothetical protein DFH09DRAFT_1327315 [Mycena vulgaris]|nr:hypothetical protein DFH09DRAFT_1327315 [Mycena vulgaris]
MSTNLGGCCSTHHVDPQRQRQARRARHGAIFTESAGAIPRTPSPAVLYTAKMLADAQAGTCTRSPRFSRELLTYCELLLHAGGVCPENLSHLISAQCMNDSFIMTGDAIVAFKANRDSTVRRMVLAMILTFASYNTLALKGQTLDRASSFGSRSRTSATKVFPPSHTRSRADCTWSPTAAALGAEMKRSPIKGRLKEAAGIASSSAACGCVQIRPLLQPHAQPPTPAARPASRDARPALATLGHLSPRLSSPCSPCFCTSPCSPCFCTSTSSRRVQRVCLGQIARAIPPLWASFGTDFSTCILSETLYARLARCQLPIVSGSTPKSQAQGQPSKELPTLAPNTLGTFDFSGLLGYTAVDDDAPEVRPLLRMLKDPASSGHQHTVNEGLMSIFKTRKFIYMGSLTQIMPEFTSYALGGAPGTP